MNRRGFLKLLALLPGAALPVPLAQVFNEPARVVAPPAIGAPVIRVITSVGPIEFATTPEMWRFAGDTITFAGQLQFEAQQTMVLECVEVETVLGTFRMDVRSFPPFPIAMTSASTFTLSRPI